MEFPLAEHQQGKDNKKTEAYGEEKTATKNTKLKKSDYICKLTIETKKTE